MKKLRAAGHLLLLAASLLSACASAKKSAEAKDEEIADLKAQVSTLQSKIGVLENKLAAMNDKVDRTRTSADNAMNVHSAKPSAVVPHAADKRGESIDTPSPLGDPEAGFTSNDAVTSYRQAKILFNTRKYPEAILAFSAFLERFADHVLAGSAQFHIGESYFKQKENKLALQEFSRVLTAYDRSPHMPAALARMAEIEDTLKQEGEAARHRQLLTQLFPTSPAAASLNQARAAPPDEATPRETASPSAPAASAPAASARSASPPLDEPPATAPVPQETP